MAKEILAVPEDCLDEVIRVIRSGLENLKFTRYDVGKETREQLTTWCDEEDDYLNRTQGKKRGFRPA